MPANAQVLADNITNQDMLCQTARALRSLDRRCPVSSETFVTSLFFVPEASNDERPTRFSGKEVTLTSVHSSTERPYRPCWGPLVKAMFFMGQEILREQSSGTPDSMEQNFYTEAEALICSFLEKMDEAFQPLDL